MTRASVLARLGAAMSGDLNARRAAVAARFQYRPRYQPTFAEGSGPLSVSKFVERLVARAAEAFEIASLADLPGLVTRVADGGGQMPRLVHGGSQVFAGLSWEGVEIVASARAGAEIGVSLAVAGVAETGSLVIASGVGAPIEIAFLSDTHVVVIERAAIVATLEEACDRAFGGQLPPRALSFMSGPSRTGDIGGRIVLGAHGPKRLIVVVVGAA